VNQKNKQPRIDEKTPDETLQESRCKKSQVTSMFINKNASNTQQPRKPIKMLSKTIKCITNFKKGSSASDPLPNF
jgi:hypothetical protein